MAIIGKRDYWIEYNAGNAEIITSGGISGNTLKANFVAGPEASYSMRLDSERMALFTSPKIEAIFDAELNVNSASDGPQVLSGVRLLEYNPASPGGLPARYGFLAGLIKFGGGGPVGWFAMKINDWVFSLLGAGAISGVSAKFRIRSDDEGSNVRFQLEMDEGSGYSELINASYGDMAALIGEIGEVSFSCVVGSDTPAINPGDHALLDNIQIDEQSVILP